MIRSGQVYLALVTAGDRRANERPASSSEESNQASACRDKTGRPGEKRYGGPGREDMRFGGLQETSVTSRKLRGREVALRRRQSITHAVPCHAMRGRPARQGNHTSTTQRLADTHTRARRSMHRCCCLTECSYPAIMVRSTLVLPIFAMDRIPMLIYAPFSISPWTTSFSFS